LQKNYLKSGIEIVKKMKEAGYKRNSAIDSLIRKCHSLGFPEASEEIRKIMGMKPKYSQEDLVFKSKRR
jgi:hypothetical protein